jgi:hypothetical protein
MNLFLVYSGQPAPNGLLATNPETKLIISLGPWLELAD